jgi:hypothetical protein
MRYAKINGVSSLPSKTLENRIPKCPFCEAEVFARMGDIKSHHWAHKNGESCQCDSILTNKRKEQYGSGGIMSLWHECQQDCWDPDWQETVIEINHIKHIADVLIPHNNVVIEFQHSRMSLTTMSLREEHYQYNMIWILDSETYSNDIGVFKHSKCPVFVHYRNTYVFYRGNDKISISFSKLKNWLLSYSGNCIKDHFDYTTFLGLDIENFKDDIKAISDREYIEVQAKAAKQKNIQLQETLSQFKFEERLIESQIENTKSDIESLKIKNSQLESAKSSIAKEEQNKLQQLLKGYEVELQIEYKDRYESEIIKLKERLYKEYKDKVSSYERRNINNLAQKLKETYDKNLENIWSIQNTAKSDLDKMINSILDIQLTYNMHLTRMDDVRNSASKSFITTIKDIFKPFKVEDDKCIFIPEFEFDFMKKYQLKIPLFDQLKSILAEMANDPKNINEDNINRIVAICKEVEDAI